MATAAAQPVQYIKGEKCEFHRHTIMFLGYVIDGHKQGQRSDFLRFTNIYCCFIRGCSSVAAPLTNLLKGKPK